MRVSKLAATATLSLLFLGTQAIAQATFMPVTPPDDAANGVVAIGINDKGEIAGSYSSDGTNQLGIVGSIDGTYDSFDLDGNRTQARGVNNQGKVIGFYWNVADDGTVALNQFEREKNGTLTVITKDGTPLWGIGQGINASGDIVGDYVGEPESVPLRGGYQGKNAEWDTDVTLPFPTLRVAARAINAQGDVAGWFITEAGDSVQGFLQKDGTTHVLVHPDAGATTYIQGLNNKGEMSGGYQDSDGNFHGFYLDSDLESWTSFDGPGLTTTQAWQINNQGQIALSGNDGTTVSSFIYCPKKSGVCSGNKGKSGKLSKAKGQGAMNGPASGRGNGPVDPDNTPRKLGHNM